MLLAAALLLLQDWSVSDADVFRRVDDSTLELLGSADSYRPPVRSPRRIALAGDDAYLDFDLTVEGQQTGRAYGHRDLCVFFGFAAPDRFRYVHLATTPDDHACNIFVVDGAPRARIADVPEKGVEWGPVHDPEGDAAPWHKIRVRRAGAEIAVWFDDVLVLEATDPAPIPGLVGVGSFDDSGRFRAFAVEGKPVGELASPFEALGARAGAGARTNWPMGAGPHGNWNSDGAMPPLNFSLEMDENVRWRLALPETGQGGIAVHSGRAYVATMAPWDPTNALSEEDAERFHHAIEGRSVVGAHVDAHCVDAETGEVLWTRRLEGRVPAIYTYPFSDATSASPVTDGEHVWFTNAAGRIACFTRGGELVWEREYTPTFAGPFNKQFEPFLVRDGKRQVLVHMEPLEPPDSADVPADAQAWHFLFGLDAATGEVLWRSDDALTQYNAPTLVTRADGPAALIGRGGPHAVPERPVGLSLVRLTGEDAGRSIWRYEDPRGNHEASLQTMAHDERYAYWVMKTPRNAVALIDIATGEEVREISLVRGITRTSFDAANRTWRRDEGLDLERGVFPARYSAIAANGALYFQCYATAWGKPTIGPAYSFGRLDAETGRVEYLEVPTDVVRDERGSTSWLWRTDRKARPLNSRGEEVTGDDRSRWSGWDWVFNGSPTRVGDRLYFTLANGLVYVLDARTARFDGGALLAVNDLGPSGGVWSANSITYALGSLFHRTGAELVRIGY